MKDLNYTQATMDVIYLLLSFFVTSQAQSQPNIVFIFIDDLGWNDVGFHGFEIMVYFLQKLKTFLTEIGNQYCYVYHSQDHLEYIPVFRI